MNKQQKIKHWQGIVEHQQSCGLTIIQFCSDNKINAYISLYGSSTNSGYDLVELKIQEGVYVTKIVLWLLTPSPIRTGLMW